MTTLNTSAKSVQGFNGSVSLGESSKELVELSAPVGELIIPWSLTLPPYEEVFLTAKGVTIVGLSSNTIKNTSLTDKTYNFELNFGTVYEDIRDGSKSLTVEVINSGEPTTPIGSGGTEINTGQQGGGRFSGGGGNTSNGGTEFPEIDNTIIR